MHLRLRKRWEGLLEGHKDSLKYRFAETFLDYWATVLGREHGFDGIRILAVDFTFRHEGSEWNFSDFSYTIAGHWISLLDVVEAGMQPPSRLLAEHQAHEKVLLAAREAMVQSPVLGARVVLEPTFALFVVGREVLSLPANPSLVMSPPSEHEVSLPGVTCFTNKREFRRWVASMRSRGIDRAFMTIEDDRLVVCHPEDPVSETLRGQLEDVKLPEPNEVDGWWRWMRDGQCVRFFVDERNRLLLACQQHIWESRRQLFLPGSQVREIEYEEAEMLNLDRREMPIGVEAMLVGFATRNILAS